ncbi:MAG: tandem-95 repeat protein, partial [Gammaproteobacteria bacterium]
MSYLWTFVSVPPTSTITDANLSGATTATPSFTPDVTGQYLLRLDVTDGDLTDTDQVLVTANVAPNAADDSYTLIENTTLTEPAPGILANDTDGNSDPLTAALVTDVANGTLALNADGSFIYTPDTDFEGTDSFTYLANDGSADSNAATVTITITHANESPVAVDDAYTTDEETSLVVPAPGVLGNDTDFESDPLTAVLDTPPANGTLTLNPDGSFTYTPNPDFNGTDTFTYHANDGLSDSNVATVSITVDTVNDVPSFTVGPDETVLEGAGAQTVNPWATGISPGPADEAGQTVSFNVTGNTDPALFSAAPAVSAAGVLTYTPAADASGSATITLTLADDGGTANGGVDTSAPQSFTITVDNINDEPSFTAGPDQTINEGAGPQTVNPWATGISAGSNESGQTLTFNITGNTNAALFSAGPAISAAGVLTYTPAADANGTATITLTLSDDGGTANGGDDTSASQSFTITVNAVNDAPAFNAGPNQSVDEDAGAQSVSGWATGISPGPADEAGQTVSFNITGNTNPGLFSAPPAVSPTGTLSYTSASNAFGSATITLSLSDSGGTANGGIDTSAAQNFTITVNAVNDAPSFTAGGNQTVLEDAGLVTVNPWATAISPGPANESGQTVGFNITGNTNPGLFSAGPAVSPAGTLSFTPAPNAFGNATITLLLQDNGGTANGGVDTSGQQGFSITVMAVNDPPSVTPPAAYAAHAHIGINIPDGATDLFDGSTITDVDG